MEGLIRRMVEERAVVVFSKSNCGMSHSVVTLITGYGANPTVYELDRLPNGSQLERALLLLGCDPAVPAIYIGEQLVGGAKELMTLQVRNQLGPLLIRAGAIWL